MQPVVRDSWKFPVFGPFWPKNAILGLSVAQIGKSRKEHYDKLDFLIKMCTQLTSYDQRFTKYGNFLFWVFCSPFRPIWAFPEGQNFSLWAENESIYLKE